MKKIIISMMLFFCVLGINTFAQFQTLPTEQIVVKIQEDGEAQSIDLTEELAVITNDIQVLENNLSSVSNNLDSTIQTSVGPLIDHVNSINNDLDTLELNVNSISNDLDTLELNVNSISNDLDTLELNVNSISNDLDTLELNVNSISNDLDTLELNVNSISNDLDNIDSVIQTSITPLIGDVSSISNDLDTLELNANSISNDLDTLESNAALLNQNNTFTGNNQFNRIYFPPTTDPMSGISQNNFLLVNIARQLEVNGNTVLSQQNSTLGTAATSQSLADNLDHVNVISNDLDTLELNVNYISNNIPYLNRTNSYSQNSVNFFNNRTNVFKYGIYFSPSFIIVNPPFGGEWQPNTLTVNSSDRTLRFNNNIIPVSSGITSQGESLTGDVVLNAVNEVYSLEDSVVSISNDLDTLELSVASISNDLDNVDSVIQNSITPLIGDVSSISNDLDTLELNVGSISNGINSLGLYITNEMVKSVQPWSANTTNIYLKNQLVRYTATSFGSGNVYYAKTYISYSSLTNFWPVPPYDSTYWGLFTENAVGPQGPRGITGDDGLNGLDGVGNIQYGVWDKDKPYIYDTNTPIIVSRSGRWYDILQSSTNRDPLLFTNFWAISIDKGSDGVLAPTNLVFRGPYNAAQVYTSNDMVTYNGSTFYTLANNVLGITPTTNNNSYWLGFALRGQDGDKGNKGDKGDPGDVLNFTNIVQYYIIETNAFLLNTPNSTRRYYQFVNESSGTAAFQYVSSYDIMNGQSIGDLTITNLNIPTSGSGAPMIRFNGSTNIAIRYNATSNRFEQFTGSTNVWMPIGSGSGGGAFVTNEFTTNSLSVYEIVYSGTSTNIATLNANGLTSQTGTNKWIYQWNGIIYNDSSILYRFGPNWFGLNTPDGQPFKVLTDAASQFDIVNYRTATNLIRVDIDNTIVSSNLVSATTASNITKAIIVESNLVSSTTASNIASIIVGSSNLLSITRASELYRVNTTDNTANVLSIVFPDGSVQTSAGVAGNTTVTNLPENLASTNFVIDYVANNIPDNIATTNFVIDYVGDSVVGAFEMDLYGRLMPRSITNWIDKFWQLDENGDLSPMPVTP